MSDENEIHAATLQVQEIVADMAKLQAKLDGSHVRTGFASMHIALLQISQAIRSLAIAQLAAAKSDRTLMVREVEAATERLSLIEREAVELGRIVDELGKRSNEDE